MQGLIARFIAIITRLTGLIRVEIVGDSMLPTYQSGQRIWVKIFSKPLSEERIVELQGRVVLVEREEYPGIYLLKRLDRVKGDLIWVEGDNKLPSIEPLQSDSRKFGWLSRDRLRGLAILSWGIQKK